MELKELRQKSIEKLHEALRSAQAELHTLQMSLASGQLKRVREIRRVRGIIARILTVLASKQHD